MLKIIYDPENGLVLPESKVLPFMIDLVNATVQNDEVHTQEIGCDMMLLGLRVAMKRAQAEPTKVTVHRNGYDEIVTLDKHYGFTSYNFWPNTQLNMLRELITGEMPYENT